MPQSSATLRLICNAVAFAVTSQTLLFNNWKNASRLKQNESDWLRCHGMGPVRNPGLPRELAKLLTRIMQPGTVSPGGDYQAQWYHLMSFLSESGESLRHVGCYSAKCVWGKLEADHSVVMRSPCAGARRRRTAHVRLSRFKVSKFPWFLFVCVCASLIPVRD
jgi:hypothetical protein